jgi:hypothetical protein
VAKVPGYVLPNSDNVWSLFPVQGRGNLSAGTYTAVLGHDDLAEHKFDVVRQ